MLNQNFFLLLSVICLITFASCKHDDPVSYTTVHHYPKEVRNILVAKCATAGCHDNISKDAADGLSLISWEKLFEGGRNGAAVIPYRPDQSSLMFFVNTFSDLGISLQPVMPYQQSALSRSEVLTLKQWIMNGAPDEFGFVKFSDNPERKKIYVANQGCDLVAVYDAETKLIMRYVDIGISSSTESPHMVRVSPDGEYWYVVFYNGSVLQRFRTSDDSFAGQVTIGQGSWNTVYITPDSKKAFAVNWAGDGTIAYVDLEKMALMKTYQGSGLFTWPHGIASGANEKWLYVTAQTGNYIYKIDITNPLFPDVNEVVLETGLPKNVTSKLDPHELVFSPDGAKYFVTCQKSNEVRVMQTSNDSLLAVIPVGDFPQEPVVSFRADYLFVSCQEDTTVIKDGRGSVAIIDMASNTLIKHVFTGFQPHGLAVDDEMGLVYVANRNRASQGPSPHHTSSCGGRNGYMTSIDMATLQLTDFRSEVSVDPFSVATRR